MTFCSACGTQRASTSDRFCRSCGQAHDATPYVPEPGEATVVRLPPAAAPAPAPGAPPPPPAPSPFLGNPPPPPPPSSSAGGGRSLGLLLTVVGVVLAVLVGAFVVWQFVWPRGGAGSPEAAVEELLTAGTDQDPLAVLDLIAPDEVEGLGALVSEARDRAREADLAGDDRLTDAIDVELSDLDFDVEELGDDMARVSLVGGRYDASWDPAKLPDRLAFLRDLSESDSESGEVADLLGGNDVHLTTVKVDGRWYVSAFASAAEYAYGAAVQETGGDIDDPDYAAYGADVEPVVGKTPENVIIQLADAISKSDADRLLATLPADLVRPLRPYAGIVEDALDGRYSEGALSLDITVDGLDVDVQDLDDDRVRVTIQAGTFVATATEEGYDADTASATIDGRCVTGQESSSEPETWCLGGDDEAAEIASDLGLDSFFVVMRKVDDGFQLDPIATVAEYGGIALASIDGDLIDQMIDTWKDEL